MTARLSTEPTVGEQEAVAEPDSAEGTAIREILAILAITALADITLYRGHGYGGLAAFVLLAPLLLLVGQLGLQSHRSMWVIGCMTALISARLLWYGSPLLVGVAFVWLFAFAAALHGHTPFFTVVLGMASQSVVAGCRALWEYQAIFRRASPRVRTHGTMTVVLPVLAFVAFSTLFILANPDAVTFVGRHIQRIVKATSDWFIDLALRPTELLFWITVIWIAAGLMRPILHLSAVNTVGKDQEKPIRTPLFPAYRNTLLTVIGLFAVYLVYEFYSLWTRDFPEGFYYAGYAHEGAAWLTAALALATLTLSVVFSRQIRNDPRLHKLRSLAWIWSLQNLLLSLAVYNRLFIYIDFNGMTRMRIVGLFGISVVVVGFLLVVWKIARGEDFLWLIRRQMWALAIAVYLFVLVPVDAIAVSYNVRRILAGDLSASMQVGVQELDLEGALSLVPLLDCSTPEIKDGAAALIAERYSQLESDHTRRQQAGWTAYQASDSVALRRFLKVRNAWKQYEDDAKRRAAIERFYDFAFRWY